MEKPFKNYKPTDATKALEKLSLLWYLTFFPKFWRPPSDLNLSPTFMKIYDGLTKAVYVMLMALAFFTIGALWTQPDLNQNQKCSRNLSIIGSPCTIFFTAICLYNRSRINELLYNIIVVLKEEFNDKKAEKAMIAKIKLYVSAYTCLCVINLTFMTVPGVMEVVKGEGGFVTYISVWPDVNDPSTTALVARVVIYIMWFIVFIITIGIYSIILSILIALNHQFKNLQSYFYTIDDTFSDSRLTQTEKEMTYEKAFIKGIRLHVLTLQCVGACQEACGMILNSQLINLPAIMLLSLIPDILVSDDDWATKLTRVPILVNVLMILGFYMWNAGDITDEASKLPDAIYASGWHNCHGRSSVRVRKLVTIAMSLALQPVEIKAFGFLVLSYEAYVTIVKTTYSVFTVFF